MTTASARPHVRSTHPPARPPADPRRVPPTASTHRTLEARLPEEVEAHPALVARLAHALAGSWQQALAPALPAKLFTALEPYLDVITEDAAFLGYNSPQVRRRRRRP